MWMSSAKTLFLFSFKSMGKENPVLRQLSSPRTLGNEISASKIELNFIQNENCFKNLFFVNTRLPGLSAQSFNYILTSLQGAVLFYGGGRKQRLGCGVCWREGGIQKRGGRVLKGQSKKKIILLQGGRKQRLRCVLKRERIQMRGGGVLKRQSKKEIILLQGRRKQRLGCGVCWRERGFR